MRACDSLLLSVFRSHLRKTPLQKPILSRRNIRDAGLASVSLRIRQFRVFFNKASDWVMRHDVIGRDVCAGVKRKDPRSGSSLERGVFVQIKLESHCPVHKCWFSHAVSLPYKNPSSSFTSLKPEGHRLKILEKKSIFRGEDFTLRLKRITDFGTQRTTWNPTHWYVHMTGSCLCEILLIESYPSIGADGVEWAGRQTPVSSTSICSCKNASFLIQTMSKGVITQSSHCICAFWT